MRKLLLLLLLILLVVVGSADAQFVVRTIYFQPTDAPGPTDRIASLMTDVQDFYRVEMERHDYGTKTFRLEADNTGTPIVHIVKGRYTASHYQSQTWDRISPELPGQFQKQNNIHVIIIGNLTLVDNSFCGLGWDFVGTGISQGFVLVPSSVECLTVPVIAHELGHTFGLRHNHDGENYLMGVGNDALSECEAVWLNKHHYFNDTQRLNASPVLDNTYPLESASKDVLRLKVDVHDDTGLYHAYFFLQNDIEMIGCASLTGQTDTAEISVSASKFANIQSVLMQVMDIDGNYYIHEIPITLPTMDETVDATYLTFQKGSQPTPNTNGLTPKNSSNQWTHWGNTLDNITNNGNPMTVSGQTFARGIAMTPGGGNTQAKVIYDLTGGHYSGFEGYIGLADEHDHALDNNANPSCRLGGSVIFRFDIDGETAFESDILTGSDDAMEVRFDIPLRSKELQIHVSNAGDTNWCDAAVIGDAKLINATVSIPNPDVNADGVVNIQDLVLVASKLGETWNGKEDVNSDSVVNVLDLVLVANAF